MQYFKNRIFISDADTVSPEWDLLSVKYHYAWMESQICKYLTDEKTVLDIGPGYGHWLKFYKSLEFDMFDGIELSKPMAEKLGCAFGNIVNYNNQNRYDVINAIGILHHIMKDSDLIKAIENIKEMSKGLIFIGTRFDFFNSRPISKFRKFRLLNFWKEHFDIVGIERSNPGKLRKHLDLLVCK